MKRPNRPQPRPAGEPRPKKASASEHRILMHADCELLAAKAVLEEKARCQRIVATSEPHTDGLLTSQAAAIGMTPLAWLFQLKNVIHRRIESGENPDEAPATNAKAQPVEEIRVNWPKKGEIR